MTACFDACKYITKGEMFEIRGERMTDREVIIEYVRGNASDEELEATRIAVSLNMQKIWCPYCRVDFKSTWFLFSTPI